MEILESFATQYVRDYRSEIFLKDNWDFSNFYNTLTQKNWNYSKGMVVKNWEGQIIDKHMLGEESRYALGEVVYDNYWKTYDVNLELLFERPLKISLAKFELNDEGVKLYELNRRVTKSGNYKAIKLTDEQFHNYLAKLMLCMIVYFHFILYDSFARQKFKVKKIDYSILPDKIQLILQVFNLRIEQYFKESTQEISVFLQGLK